LPFKVCSQPRVQRAKGQQLTQLNSFSWPEQTFLFRSDFNPLISLECLKIVCVDVKIQFLLLSTTCTLRLARAVLVRPTSSSNRRCDSFPISEICIGLRMDSILHEISFVFNDLFSKRYSFCSQCCRTPNRIFYAHYGRPELNSFCSALLSSPWLIGNLFDFPPPLRKASLSAGSNLNCASRRVAQLTSVSRQIFERRRRFSPCILLLPKIL